MNIFRFKKIFIFVAVVLTVSFAFAQDSASDYRAAAERGDKVAQYELSRCYSNGKGVEKDDTQAVFWVRKSALQGHSRAQSVLGVHYYYGTGVEQDKKEAMYWFARAERNEDGSFVGTFLTSANKTYMETLKKEGFTPPPPPVYVTQNCTACNGTGKVTCSTCNGQGKIKVMDGYTIKGGFGVPDMHMPATYSPCWSCMSTTKVNCSTCKGSGKVQVLQTN